MKQEREYKEALDTFNEKNREKVQLITKLMEVSFEFSVIIWLNQERTEFVFALINLNGLFSVFLNFSLGRWDSWLEKARS